MTDTPKPTGPSRRKNASREPATIDLQATVVDDSLRDERMAAEAERTESDSLNAGQSESERPAFEPKAEPTSEPTGGPSTGGPSTEEPVTPASSEPPPAGPATPVREPERRGPGFGSLAAAGLVGGVVGAGLLYGLQEWRAREAGADPRFAQVEQRLDSLARQDAVRALEGRIGAVETAQTNLSSRVQTAQSLAERGAAQAQDALNRPLPAAPAGQAAPAPDNSGAVAEITSRVAALEEQVRGAAQGATSAAQNATAASDSAKAAAQALDQRVASQEQRLAQASERLTGLDGRVAALDQRLGGVGEQVGAVDQKVAALTKQVAEGGSETTRAGTRVVLADRLNDALREGAPYREELATFRRLAPDDGKLAPLEPFAERGAPTPSALAQSFKPIGERMIRETRQGSDGWTDRLARMAERIVTVRSVDDPNATDTPSLVARIGAALDRNALQEAAAAFDALPEPARRIAGDWGQTLKQRAAAEAAARAVSAEAVAALTPPTR